MRSLHTPLCDLLGIRYPILNAGIGPAAGPELAAAVTNAGGFGVLGGGGMPHEAMRKLVARTRTLTNGPFGINAIVDDPAVPEDLEHRRDGPRGDRSLLGRPDAVHPNRTSPRCEGPGAGRLARRGQKGG